MKQWPLVASFVLFIALCASVAYWAMQMFTPPVRTAAAPPPAAPAPPNLDAAAGLFGGRSNVAVASNFQLKGVIFSGNPNSSVAILATDGKPAQAIRANAEVMPGVIVKEVHRQYVLLSDGGIIKRVNLPDEARSDGSTGVSSSAPTTARSAPAAPPRVIVNPTGQAQPAPPPNVGVPYTPPPAANPQQQMQQMQQQPQNQAGQGMPANAGALPSMDMGSASIGYNPAGGQPAFPPPQVPSTPEASSMQGATPGQAMPAPQSLPQTQPLPGALPVPTQ